MTRERVLEWTPIRVGSGPFDLAPEGTPPCVFCSEALVERVPGVSALGVGVYARSRWIVSHIKCVREAEACPCACHTNGMVHGPRPDSVCCSKWNEVEP